MKIFDVMNGHVVPHAEALLIPEFKHIWDRDKDPDKHKAITELSYIVFLVDESLNNPYRAYVGNDRRRELKKDLFGSLSWAPDKDLKKALKKYEELTQTVASKLLKSANYAAEKLTDWFYSVDFKKLDRNGKPLFSSRDLSANLGRMGDILKSLKTLEDFLKKEQVESTVRGGGEVGLYEIPDNNFDYGE